MKYQVFMSQGFFLNLPIPPNHRHFLHPLLEVIFHNHYTNLLDHLPLQVQLQVALPNFCCLKSRVALCKYKTQTHLYQPRHQVFFHTASLHCPNIRFPQNS